MCGIAGIFDPSSNSSQLEHHLSLMGNLISHRGPDDSGQWVHPDGTLGMAHRRLSVIDLSSNAKQPMTEGNNNWIVFNGEIYNYKDLRRRLEGNFRTNSDTEVILKAYQKWGKECVKYFRGMFSFALWDESQNELFCARDHFGIKPFYYWQSESGFYFASETKALLPFIKSLNPDLGGLKDYLTFQLCLGKKTMFKNIFQLEPAHFMTISKKGIEIQKYWDVNFEPDFSKNENSFNEELKEIIKDSIKAHLIADVPVGAYLSGGYDSSAIASIANNLVTDNKLIGFTGKYTEYGSSFDESFYARQVAKKGKFEIQELEINGQNFLDNIQKVIYHLDYPVAGPGSFSQYMISQLASKSRKVVLGGQGGDEIFGGYTRYLIAYFEQCIKAAINGTYKNGNFVVTYESIIPNLKSLSNYTPLLKQFWKEGLFDDMHNRYFNLINRAPNLSSFVDWEILEGYSSRNTFNKIFYGENVKKESYFDLMTHFDFKTLLPGLLQVEDRMSMAHGLESRVPLLDVRIVELAAKMPADIKFKNGEMKYIFKKAIKEFIPKSIYKRKDKMGFPTPVNNWFKNEANEMLNDVLRSFKSKNRGYIDNESLLQRVSKENDFGRNVWGAFSLELWFQTFIDNHKPVKI
jgi:asparagine synthase (glutamine-hydrolysing)